MIRHGLVAFVARIPLSAAFELDRDDVDLAFPMTASGLLVYIDPVYFCVPDLPHHVQRITRISGESRRRPLE